MKKLLAALLVFGFVAVSGANDSGISSIITYPEGTSGEVQFEQDGYFTGDSNFTYSTTTRDLSVLGVDASTITASSATLTAATIGTLTNTAFSTLQSTVAAISSDTTTLRTELNVIKSTVAAISQDTTTIRTELDIVKSTVVAVCASTTAIQAQVDVLISTVASVSASTQAIQIQLDNVAVSTGATQTDLDALEAVVLTATNTTIPAIAVSTGALSISTANIQSALDTLEAAVLLSTGTDIPATYLQLAGGSVTGQTLFTDVSTYSVVFSSGIKILANGIKWPDGTVQISSPVAGGIGDVVLSATQTFTGSPTFTCTAGTFTITFGSMTVNNDATFNGELTSTGALTGRAVGCAFLGTPSGAFADPEKISVFAVGSKLYDTDNAYNTTTGSYTVPMNGDYLVIFQTGVYGSTETYRDLLGAAVWKNTTRQVKTCHTMPESTPNKQGNTVFYPITSCIISCVQGDYITARTYSQYTSPVYAGDSYLCIRRLP